MKIKPLADRVVVRPLEADEKTKGGLYVPDTAKERPQQGEIVAVGPGRVTDEGKKIPIEVKVGDRILYGKYSGTEVNYEGTEYLIMRESDIFAIL
ncbi:MAG TPA: co-chaperone GroES [Candidatus Kryptonia bacterium]